MSIKLALGIILPVAVILVLVIVSTAAPELSVYTETVSSVPFDALFVASGSPETPLGLQTITITITNDFFLPKSYELPTLLACLYDIERAGESISLNVVLSEGSKREENDVLMMDAFFPEDFPAEHMVQGEAHSSKQVRVLVSPNRVYVAQRPMAYYEQYDEVLLIPRTELNKDYYLSCNTWRTEDLSAGYRIPIAHISSPSPS